MVVVQTSLTSESWKEEFYGEVEGQRKQSRVTASFIYTGDLMGRGVADYLMVYRADHTVSFVGYETIDGQFADKVGSLVLMHVGEFTPAGVSSQWRVVEGASSGDVVGLTGAGTITLAGPEPFLLSFTFTEAS